MITVSVKINASMENVWNYFTQPEHIVNWNFASDDWHSTYAENDLTVNGIFKYTMAAKDGSFSFDFEGTYTQIEMYKTIAYTMGDGRKAILHFTENDNETEVVELFEPENENPEEMQQFGWQAILNNFKKYVEQG
ncbi:MAG: SRPBCC domain-containing protein [Candidatus Methylacidiphilales bacterium]